MVFSSIPGVLEPLLLLIVCIAVIMLHSLNIISFKALNFGFVPLFILAFAIE